MNEIIQIVLFFGIGHRADARRGPVHGEGVSRARRTFLHPVFLPVEKLVYRLTGVDPSEEMTWLKYLWAVLIMACVGFASLHGDLHDAAMAAAESAEACPIAPGTWRSCRPGVSPATPTGNLTRARRP